MSKKEEFEYYSWKMFDNDVRKIVKRLKRRKRRFDGVWGPPRGGLPLAVTLSHALEIPFLESVQSVNTLIVDDIADTGKRLRDYANTHFIVTLYYHRQSTFVPDIWLRMKHKRFIKFPWEKSG